MLLLASLDIEKDVFLVVSSLQICCWPNSPTSKACPAHGYPWFFSIKGSYAFADVAKENQPRDYVCTVVSKNSLLAIISNLPLAETVTSCTSEHVKLYIDSHIAIKVKTHPKNIK